LLLTACSEAPLIREGPQRETVADEVALPVQAVHAALLQRFGSLPVSEPPLLSKFRASPVVSNRDGVQRRDPNDVSLIGWGNEDPAMRRYMALPPEQRMHDIHAYQIAGDSWLSEYHVGGVAVEFRTDFLLHLEPIGETATRIEVLEAFPRANAGRRFGWAHHTVLPGWKNDIRRVPPTVIDRERVLEHALALLVHEEATSDAPK
jgi:hypothetical protein